MALRVVGARLDRDRDGLLVFFVGVVLVSVAGAVNLLADLLVAAAPVVVLAGGMTVLAFAPRASRRVEVELFTAGGARRVHVLSSFFYSFRLESDVLLCESRLVIAL